MPLDRPNCATDQVWDIGDADLKLEKLNFDSDHHPSIVAKVLPLQVIHGSSSKEYPKGTVLEEMSQDDLRAPPPRGKGLPKLTRFEVCRIITLELAEGSEPPTTDPRLQDYRGHLLESASKRLKAMAVLCKTGTLARRRQ
jgi:hypothetical protein